ncbi:MAG: PAS domain-containing sensor histidine kinase [Altibacter sp.]|uniref:sensor histidine kinase n=1 Tax=Altibacter sp. TaxID=2024823 RepID=UPI001D73A5D7|nr:PAS domain-containing sensor histidine kinase [Altibacter sp.]MBZ0327697.1 PAS domain-containing sensor histidine kinase [Altibacter sp.]
MNFLAQKRSKILLEEKKNHPPANIESVQNNNFYYQEIAQLTATGGWSINFIDKTSSLDPEARRILNVPQDFRPSLRTALDFFAPEFRDIISKAFFEGTMGKPYSGVMKMLTYDQKEFWVKATGKPIYNDSNQVIGIRGVFQDITDLKQKELTLENSLGIIESQNTRLFNFANTVSHNLRSHASNLQLTIELLNSAESKDEEAELKNGLSQISEHINTTINHLNEIVAIQAKARDTKKNVSFRESLLSVMHALQDTIFNSEAEIFSDFSEVPSIEYIPAYLESIFLNLITNAIKFKHPNRRPIIDICTYKVGDDSFLMIKDNGSGIDLQKYGSRVFNIYATFHSHEDSNGVGLFITKNQVEALQGTIHVESHVNVGTTFTIKF